MNEFLIDTNIYSHSMRAEPAVVSLLRRASRIAISSISIGELLSGFKGGTQERKNREELDQSFRHGFAALKPMTGGCDIKASQNGLCCWDGCK